MIRAIFVLATVILASLPAHAMRSVSIPQDDRVFQIGESEAFDETPYTYLMKEGVDNRGAVYRYEVPVEWNGDLVMYAHGFRGRCTDENDLPPLTVDNPPIREHLLQQGYAWAASSYAKSCYDVKDGVESTNRLARIFSEEVDAPNRTLIMGFSMGGHVTGAAIEMFPNVRCPAGEQGLTCRRFIDALGELSGGIRYDGAAPMCGVMGDVELFDYFGDFAFGAEAIASAVNPLVQSQFPPPLDYASTTVPMVVDTLFEEFPTTLTDQGELLKDLLRQISGGERPIFDAAFPFFQGLLFSLAGTDGSLDGVMSGSLYDNRKRVYQLDNNLTINADEQSLNDTILRIRRDRGVNIRRFLRLKRVPEITGRIDIPVISVHTLGDLFVPFVMQQTYAREVATQGRSDLLVSRATRGVSHCDFSFDEVARTFDDLALWVNEGVKPAGDNILDAEVVADPLFGCQFTEGLSAVTPEFLRGDACSVAP
jgi:pimeloyl-ACP methyl ester carboxylesterase